MSDTMTTWAKSAGLEGGVYVRVGSTNRRADSELIDELRRFASAETLDEQGDARVRLGSARLPSCF